MGDKVEFRWSTIGLMVVIFVLIAPYLGIYGGRGEQSPEEAVQVNDSRPKKKVLPQATRSSQERLNEIEALLGNKKKEEGQ